MPQDINYRQLAAKFVVDCYGNPSTLRYYREDWWVWNRGRYQIQSDSNLVARISNWLDEEGHDSKITNVRELRAKIMALPNVVVDDSMEMPLWIEVDHYDQTCNYLSFSNQLVDLDVVTRDNVNPPILNPTPKWFSAVALNYRYDPRIECPKFLSLLDMVIPDKPSQDVLQEMFGYCLTRDTDMRSMMILFGEARTGKSTLSNILEAMVGPENRSAVPLEGFWDRFAAQQTIGKLVNFCGDSKNIESLAEGVIKRFTGGDTILVDRKYKNPVSCKMTAKIVVATNSFPRVKDISDALWDRFIVVPMNRRLEEHEIDRSLLDSEKPSWPLRKELPGIFNWAIEGLKRLRNQGHFTVSQKFVQAKAEARRENCSVSQFVEERCVANSLASVTIKDFMYEYQCFCDSHNLQARPAPEVGKILRKLIPGATKRRLGCRSERQMHYEGVKMYVPR
jgi:P4 family phage/plasmid primase-like protien